VSVRPVRIYGDPVLRQRAKEVAEFDESLWRLVEDMRETMKAYNGVGLAANQVGVLQRVLVVDVPLEDAPRAQLALVNPTIESRSGNQPSEEGCLSIPGIVEEVARAQRIQIRALDEKGAPVTVEADGYLARALQHEVDHLDGVLFVDRLGVLKKQFLRRDLEALARGELPDDYHPPGAL
jgi:peptide deformylase